MSGVVPLPFDGDDLPPALPEVPEDAPSFYIATRITGTLPGSPERQMIHLAVSAMRDAVNEATLQCSEPWVARVHVPIEWTAPDQTPTLTIEQVFTGNARRVLGEADALIVYGWLPSAGVGQEITWAAQLGIPILYVEPASHPVSRQIAGTPGDIALLKFQEASDQLKDGIRRWVRSRRHVIQASAGRRRSRTLAMAPLQARLQHEWLSLGQIDRRQVAARAGLDPSLIEWWLSEPTMLAAAPLVHVLALSVILTGSTDPVVGRRELSLDQIEALLTARDEHGWDVATTTSLRHRAERELALPAVRRFRLDSPNDWTRLWEAMGS